MASRIFVIYLISFIVGVFAAPLTNFQPDHLIYFTGGLVLILPLYFRTTLLKHILVIFIFIITGIIAFQNSLPKNNENWTNYFNGENLKIQGYVNSEPTGEKLRRFYFKPKLLCESAEEVTEEDCLKNTKGNIVVTLPKTEEVNFGDELLLSGELLQTEQGEEFNYANYLAVRKVYSQMNFPEMSEEQSEPVLLTSLEQNSISIRQKLFFIKSSFVKAIENNYPEPNSSLMLGLLLGIKKSMPDELIDSFNKTGTTHIVALSGFNVTVIVMMLKKFTQHFSRRIRFWLPVTFIVLFVIMTGADAPIVRAAIMGFMLLLAKQLGRQDDATVAVFFAAFLMILFNPMIVRYDIGFQLSFACMLGLIYIYPIFERLFRKWPRIIGENLGITLAAQIAALPIILFYFGSLSVIAPLANLLILPAVPLAMFFGALASAIHFIFPSLSSLASWTGFLLTSYIIKLATLLSNLSFAAYNFNVTPLFVLVYFIIVINILFIYRTWSKNLKYRHNNYASREK